MSERTADQAGSGRRLVAAAAGLVLVCLTVATGFFWMHRHSGTTSPTAAGNAGPGEGKVQPAAAVGGVPVFAAWPKDQKPELVLVLSGQTYGYLSPCGCSRPQKGGLERRYNLIESLKAKGWPVVGLDLGDAAPAGGPHGLHNHKQDVLKYGTTMKALNRMGYAAIGLGEYDFAAQLFDLLSAFTLNNPDKPPIVLAGNLLGVSGPRPDGKVTGTFPRNVFFPGGGARPMVEAYELVAPKDRPSVVAVGVVGPDVMAKVEKQDKQFAFQANPQYLEATLAEMKKKGVTADLWVLLYAGKLKQAQAAAQAFPQFQVVLCQSDDPEPPQFPTPANGGKTMIVQVGHKGQHVGVVGAFKNADGGYDLKYQLVPLGEEYLTPDDPVALQNNKALQLLEEYTEEVKRQNLLAEFRKNPQPHPAQIQNPGANLTYVGSEACAKCHQAEYKLYTETKHSHAYAALEGAKRPGNRQFDGECIVCHTVGFEYVGGYENATKTPNLKNVGCENCHGPGSGHAANPKNQALLDALSPWKAKPTDKLPGVEFLKKMAATKPVDRATVKMPGSEQLVVNAVSGMCMRCHDVENDPKFDFYEFMPKVYHSGSKAKAAGLPPGAK